MSILKYKYINIRMLATSNFENELINKKTGEHKKLSLFSNLFQQMIIFSFQILSGNNLGSIKWKA